MLILMLAQNVQPLPQQTATRYQVGLMLIVLIGMLGIVLVLALMRSWRKQHARLQALDRRIDERRSGRGELLQDAWSTAGARLGVLPLAGAGGIAAMETSDADAALNDPIHETRDEPDIDDEDGDDEPEDPFNLFEGKDPVADSPDKPAFDDDDADDDFNPDEDPDDPFGFGNTKDPEN